VRLPLAAEPALPLEPAATAEQTRRVATVLIANSDPDWQHLIAASARTAGWRIVPVASGAAALDAIRAGPVDLVVVDLELADMHGLALLQQLQRDPQAFDIPTLLVADADMPGARDVGADVASTAEEIVERGRRLLAAPRRKGVLVVDDDPVTGTALGRILRRAGYASLAAADGKAGLALARARRPDLIITDYRMPEMDGLMLLRELRSDPALKDVPVVMVSGHATRGLARQVGDLSARLLSKPIDKPALLAEIGRLVGRATESAPL
jgi:CheY-like chemotaxis protein